MSGLSCLLLRELSLLLGVELRLSLKLRLVLVQQVIGDVLGGLPRRSLRAYNTMLCSCYAHAMHMLCICYAYAMHMLCYAMLMLCPCYARCAPLEGSPSR